MTTLANVASLAGLLAEFTADNFGIVAPFDTVAVLLILGTLLIAFTWKENYGEKNANVGMSFQVVHTYVQQGMHLSTENCF